jgi:Predicted protease with the C-terminal PDZ domain
MEQLEARRRLLSRVGADLAGSGTVIRRETGGKRSLDDFCQKFHGGETGKPALKPYTFDDVVSTLNEVAPYDWRGFLNTRISQVAPHAPLGGIENAGWKFVYNETPNELNRAGEQAFKVVDLSTTLGLFLKDDGTINDVIPGMPAHQAGVLPGGKILAVNGRKLGYDPIHAAIKAAKGTTEPIELIVESGDSYSVHRVDYHGGERYPHLERDNTKPDLLTEIAKAHAR